MKKNTAEIKIKTVKEYTTGESFPKNELFPVKTGKSTKYFFSEEAYKKWRSDADYLNKIKDHISFNLLGYKDSGSPFNTSLMKKITSFKEIGYDAFYETLIKYDEIIRRSLSQKNFGDSGDYSRIAYIVSIVNGHIRDIRKMLDEKSSRNEYLDNTIGEVIEEVENECEPKHKPKQKRDWL